jgi:hypothetical protein
VDAPIDVRTACDTIIALVASGSFTKACEIVRHLESAVPGHRGRIARAQLDVLAARVRYALWSPGEGARLQAFLDLWERTASLARVRALAARNVRHPPASGTNGKAGHATWAPTQNRHAFGLHALEWSAGRPFRWTRAVAGFRLRAAHARNLVTVHTMPVGLPRPLALFWKRRRLAPQQGDACRITVELPGTGSPDGWFVVLSDCVSRADLAPQETRQLGIPVFGIEVTDGS